MNTAKSQELSALSSRFLSGHPQVLEAARVVASDVAKLPRLSQCAPDPCALIYGGFVRDVVRGVRPSDADLQVYGVIPAVVEARLRELFPGQVKRAGRQYEVLKVRISRDLTLDVSVPRLETGVHSPHEAGDPLIHPIEAVKIRDFTINSLTGDPLSGEIVDHQGALSDIERGILHPVDRESFRRRAVHAFRAFQFVARMGLRPSAECRSMIAEMVSEGLTEKVPANAITEELKKLLVRGRRPSVGLEFMGESGIFDRHFLPGGLSDVARPGTPEWRRWLQRIDAGAECLRKGIYSLEERIVIMLALFWSRNVSAPLSEDDVVETLLRGFSELSVPPHVRAGVVQCLLRQGEVGMLPAGSDSKVFRLRTSSRRSRMIPARGMIDSRDESAEQGGFRERCLALIGDVLPASWLALITVHSVLTSANLSELRERFSTASASGGRGSQPPPSWMLSRREIAEIIGEQDSLIVDQVVKDLRLRRHDLFTKSLARRYVTARRALYIQGRVSGLDAEEAALENEAFIKG